LEEWFRVLSKDLIKGLSPHIYIVGQTASGKTGLSLDICESLDAEIVNTDSLLFYKGLDIGSAKPTKDELLRVKHHMIDVCEIGEDLNAASYSTKAKEILSDKTDESKVYLCVGGSGFYIDSLDKGLLPLPQTSDEIINKVSQLPNPVDTLLSVDPETLNVIAKEDVYRVKRALQVFYQTGKPLSAWKKEFPLKSKVKKIAIHIEKEDLLKRVKLRTKQMIDSGLIDEVKAVLAHGEKQDFKNWKPLKSVGYKQALDFIEGKYSSLQELTDEIVLKTMQLAKRQKTWFKKDKSVVWFEVEKDHKSIKDFIIKTMENDSWRV